MGFGRKVQDGSRFVFGQQTGHQIFVTNIALNEDVTLVVSQRRQVVQIAGIGQFVQIDDGLIMAGKPCVDKIAADKTCAAGDKNHVGRSVSKNA